MHTNMIAIFHEFWWKLSLYSRKRERSHSRHFRPLVLESISCKPWPIPTPRKDESTLPQSQGHIFNTRDQRQPLSVPSTQLLLPRRNRTSPAGRIRRNTPVGNPNIHQWLHRLEVLLAQQTKQLGDRNEMHEQRVEVRPAGAAPSKALGAAGVDVPEGIHPVRVVDVRVHAEDLPEDGAAVGEEVLREAGRLADPVAACELRERRVEIRRAGGDGRAGPAAGHRHAARRVDGGRTGQGVGRKGDRVGELADDPAADEVDVLVCGDFDGFLCVVQPGVGVASVCS